MKPEIDSFRCLLHLEAVTVPSQYDNRFYYATRQRQSYNQPHCSHRVGQIERQAAALCLRADGARLLNGANQDLLPFPMDRHAGHAQVRQGMVVQIR